MDRLPVLYSLHLCEPCIIHGTSDGRCRHGFQVSHVATTRPDPARAFTMQGTPSHSKALSSGRTHYSLLNCKFRNVFSCFAWFCIYKPRTQTRQNYYLDSVRFSALSFITIIASSYPTMGTLTPIEVLENVVFSAT